MLRGSCFKGRRFARKAALARLFYSTSILCTLVPAVAFAADTEPADRSSALETIVVTAPIPKTSATGTKTDTPLIETPASISVVTRQQMDVQGVQSVSEAVRYNAGVLATPSMSAAQRYDSFDDIKIRGFDVGSNGMLRDGLRGTTIQAWPRVESYGLESVEIFRGPSSVLYGQNSPGGLVNQITKRPQDTPYHEVELEGGSYDRIQGQFDFTGPVSEGSDWSYRLTGLARKSDSQFKFVPDDKLFIAPALTWRPDADTSLTLLADYTWDKFGPPGVVVPIYGAILPNPNGPIPRDTYLNDHVDNRRNQYSFAYLFDHRFNDVWRISSKARYGDVDISRETIQGALLADKRTLSRVPYHFDIDGSTLSLDNNAVAEWTSGIAQFQTLLGFDFRYSNEDYFLNGGPSAGTIDLYDPVYIGHMLPTPNPAASTVQTSNQYGLYAQQQVKLADRWVATAGVRQDWSDTSTRNRLTGKIPKQTDDAFTWKAGLVYLADYGLAPYVSYMTSFNPVVGTDFYGNPYKPTTGRQIEGGIKYQPVGFDSFVTVSGFDLRQQNVQTLDPNNPLNRIQTGEIASRGVEFQGVANLLRNFNVIATYTYNALKVTKSNNPVELGMRPVGLPENMGSVWGRYTFIDGGLAGLGFGLGVRYVGTTKADSANTINVPSYTLLDLAVDYDLARLNAGLAGTRLAVNVTNLADKQYYDSCSASNCSAGDDRRVLVSLKQSW